MAKKIVQVVSKNNVPVNVMCGIEQLNYVDGDVWRFPADLYADISALAKVDVSTKDRFNNVLSALLDAFNIVHKSALIASDYDIKSGKYDRKHTKQINQVAHTIEPVAQVMAQADASVIAWIKEQRSAKVEFDTIRGMLESNGWKKEQIDHHFNVAYPLPNAPKTPSVPLPPSA